MKLLLRSLAFALCSTIVLSENSADNVSMSGARSSSPRYKLDGDFSDWKTYTTGWAEKYMDYENFSRTPRRKGVAFKGFYYDNDDVYLYLFFKCTPTPQTEIDRFHAENGKETFSSNPFDLASLWIDTDLNKSTGSQLESKKQKAYTIIKPQMVTGAEFRIKLECGMFYKLDRGVESGGHYIAYSIEEWNKEKHDFEGKGKEYKSYNEPYLISHGKHGIEMAIPIRDLNLERKQKFSLTLWEDVIYSLRDTKKLVVRLK